MIYKGVFSRISPESNYASFIPNILSVKLKCSMFKSRVVFTAERIKLGPLSCTEYCIVLNFLAICLLSRTVLREKSLVPSSFTRLSLIC